jgi:hypothetical protein
LYLGPSLLCPAVDAQSTTSSLAEARTIAWGNS